MKAQLNLFEEEKKKKYKEYYDNFYKGVKERYAREREEKNKVDNSYISIRIK